jgi:hypothetical protein
MHTPRQTLFHANAGDSEWAGKVRGFLAARAAYLSALENPDEPPTPPPVASGPVVDLAAVRTCRAAARPPCAAAFDAYRFAAVRLLMTWAPNSTELREQMRLAAELAGLADPAHGDDLRHPSDVADTPEAMLALIYHSSLGLWSGERSARAAK